VPRRTQSLHREVRSASFFCDRMRETKNRVYKIRSRRWIIKSSHICCLKFNKNSLFFPRIWFFLHIDYILNKEWCKFHSQKAHDMRLSWRCLWKFNVLCSYINTWKFWKNLFFFFVLFLYQTTCHHITPQLFSKSVIIKYRKI